MLRFAASCHLLLQALLALSIVVGWSDAAAREPDFELMPQLGHSESIKAVAFSPDGRLAFSGGESFRIWDAQSGLLLQHHPGHNGTVDAIVVSPRAKQVLTGGDDSIRAWDLGTGQYLRSFEGKAGGVKVLAVSKDERILASSGDRHIRIWNARQGTLEKKLEGHTRRVTSIALSPDGRTLVSAGEDYSMRIWNVAIGQSKVIRTGKVSSVKETRGATTRTYSGQTIDAVAFSPTERIFAAAGAKGITLWHADEGTKIRSLEGHDGTGSEAVVFSADGKRLLSGGGDESVQIYDVETGKLLRKMTGHRLRVSAVAWSPDGRRVLSGSDDKTLRLWDAKTGKHLWTFRGFMDSLRAVAISPDGKLALAAAGRRSVGTGPKPPIYLWSLEHGALIRRLVDHTEEVNAVAFSPDGRQALSGASDQSMVLWDLPSGTALRRFVDWTAGGGHFVEGSVGGVQAVAFDRMSKVGFAGCGDGQIRVWDLATGKLLRTLGQHGSRVTALGVHPDGRRLVSSSADETARLSGMSRPVPSSGGSRVIASG